MPATESTWRNLKALHVVFAVSSLVMLVATVLMMAADHNREWKNYQRSFRDVESEVGAARIAEQKTADYLGQHDQLAQAWTAERMKVNGEALAVAYQQFQAATAEYSSRWNSQVADRKKAGADEIEPIPLFDFTKANVAFTAWSGWPANSDLSKPSAGRDGNSLADKAVTARGKADEAQKAATTARTAAQTAVDKAAAAEKAFTKDADELRAAATKAKTEADAKHAAAVAADQEAVAAETAATKKRDEWLAELREVLRKAKQREDRWSTIVKFRKSGYDKAKSDYDLAVGNHAPERETKRFEEAAKEVERNVNLLSLIKEDARDHRLALESQIRQITESEEKAKKALDDNTAELSRLVKAYDDRRGTVGRGVLELPVLDAFNSPLKIDQIWLPNLTFNNNFKGVARFDRCATCHQAIDKTAPGSAVEPLYPAQEKETRLVRLPAPAEPPKSIMNEKGEETSKTTRAVYGLELAEGSGIFGTKAVIRIVWANSIAATAGLQSGDVIESINGNTIYTRTDGEAFLLDQAPWGKTLDLRVRGLPQPFASHPRLDLFLGSMSPHPMQTFGCTACHDGQGSSTTFKYASHTPNNPDEEARWRKQYGWFDNHHWIYPMFPERFNQATCLKCHHDVVELEASPRFPEPPAEKLVEGYTLVRRYGCYGCHEINGFDGPNKRIGPDLRAEPNYAPGGLQVAVELTQWEPVVKGIQKILQTEVKPYNEKIADLEKKLEALKKQEKTEAEQKKFEEEIAVAKKQREPWATDLYHVQTAANSLPGFIAQAKAIAAHADDRVPRQDLLNRFMLDVTKPLAGLRKVKLETPSKVSAMLTLLKDVEAPGKLRKPGPSLRYLASKVDYDWLYNWIANPTDFRPDTRMPRFFGLHGHLEASKDKEPKGLNEAQKYEPIEIRAAAEYLLASSQPFEYLTPTAKPSNERGKDLFQKRGCLACHTHADFKDSTKFWPANEIMQGPDLSRIGAKLKKKNEDGLNWLYSWVKEPNRYHARTVMPNLFLETLTDRDGNKTDPAADITMYLAGSQQDWRPAAIPSREMTAQDQSALRDLARQYLQEKFSESATSRYLENGIPMSRASQLKGDEVALAFDAPPDASPDELRTVMNQRLLDYIGRRTISKYGCSGCHDIPGYEDSKPIGTALADWGRKDAAKLAFEQINGYVGGHGPVEKDEEHAAGHGSAKKSGSHAANPHGDLAYFQEKLHGHQREGFLWQKLLEPRSYDYMKTENKRYNERLRMPQFTFAVDKAGHLDEHRNQERIEAVMTFVLGLLSEPPPPQYVYAPDAKQKAIVRGRQVLEKYNCGGCHMLQMQRWQIGFKQFPEQPAPAVKDYDFVNPHFTPEQIEASLKKDRAGRMHATLDGLPTLRDATGEPVRLDEDGSPIPPTDTTTPGMFTFNLYQPTLIGGKPYLVKVKDPLIPEQQIEQRYREQGGHLARLLYPVVVAEGKKANTNLSAETVWGWLPPPLYNEGRKVQTKWLHDFLIDPYPIRPATVLRMPKFNMSSEEASALVAYFAASDNADSPYEFNPRGRESHLAAVNHGYTERVKKGGAAADRSHLQDAMKIVTDNNYCVKCHLVGDYRPQGDNSALAPNLNQVQNRLRPDYLKRWLANPARILPYTGMPVNIPPDKPVSQELYSGDSEQQLDAVVDLLMNFDQFSHERVSIKGLVKPAPATPPAGDKATPPGEKTEKPPE